jgi:hypothetical protein
VNDVAVVGRLLREYHFRGLRPASLAAAGYGAPRPVCARTGELVGESGPWLTWATS